MAANPVTNSRSVFCPPLPGKPGPYAADGVSRTRVPQSEQKGETCSYYALQILRNEHRIGKTPSEAQFNNRNIEIVISNNRKAHSKVDALFKPQIEFAEQLTGELNGSCTRQQASHFVEKRSHQITPELRGLLSNSLRSFCSQNTHNDFSDFIEECYEKALMKVYEPFFHAFKISAEFIEKNAFTSLETPWAELSASLKEWHEQNMVFKLSYIGYGCEESSWHPEKPIEKLIEQLQLHGPHLVKGKIGQYYYQDVPSVLSQKIEGRSILYWKPNASRKETGVNHTIVIVGAKIDNQGKQLVYFLDPLDGSDPKDMSTQKIYVMSYERLKTSIASLEGRQMKYEQDGKPVFCDQQQGKNNYAIYMPKLS